MMKLGCLAGSAPAISSVTTRRLTTRPKTTSNGGESAFRPRVCFTTLAFQASTFANSVISPCKLAEKVGFAPTRAINPTSLAVRRNQLDYATSPLKSLNWRRRRITISHTPLRTLLPIFKTGPLPLGLLLH